MSVRPKPIPGVEIRERRPRGGEVLYSYRVRFKNARGKRDQRSFDTAQDAQDFRARLRLLKRTGDLAVLERGNEALERFMGDFWRLYVEARLETSTRKKYRCLWNVHINRRLGAMELRQITRWFSRSSFSNSKRPGRERPRSEAAWACCRACSRGPSNGTGRASLSSS
jgi:hypothetical protein